MPPNLYDMLARLRRALENIQQRNVQAVVRTDFILKNVFSYLLDDELFFPGTNAENEKESDVLLAIKEIIATFRSSYSSNMRNMCSQINQIDERNTDSVLLGVANELFSDGITWARIVAFFVFIGELANLCIPIADTIYDSFSRLVRERLEAWVLDHGGWEGIMTLSTNSGPANSIKKSSLRWMRILLYGTVRLLGSLLEMAADKICISMPKIAIVTLCIFNV